VIYDRRESAINHVKEEEIPWEILSDASLVHLTGITPALSPDLRKLVVRFIKEARSRATKVSFDLNYRSMLWSPREARLFYEGIRDSLDIQISPLSDAREVLGLLGPPEDVLKDLHEGSSSLLSVVTMGDKGAMALEDGRIYRAESYPACEVDRVGGGDAFTAGLLYSLIESGDVQRALRYGNALAALKYGIPGDFALVDSDEVDDLVTGREGRGIKR
jgi:2-dehydro-3-deoxygluconokinase